VRPPPLGDGQEPLHQAGIVPGQPGLYFVGLQYLYAMSSATVTGVGRDARRVVDHLIATTSQRSGVPAEPGRSMAQAEVKGAPAGAATANL
jgi:hypothetical protein